MATNTYYQDELRYLREVGPEFARANPEIARYLSDRGSDPDVVRVDLAPSVVSSLDATIHVHATVLNDGQLEADVNVVITMDYVDRNGEPHAIVGAEGKTDKKNRGRAPTELSIDRYAILSPSVAKKIKISCFFRIIVIFSDC